METLAPSLPAPVTTILESFTKALTEACGDTLVSIILYGSAAEGRLRASSDVNLILVFRSFEMKQVDKVRESLRQGAAAIDLNAMFLLESEITAATEAFAVKFSDVIGRHRVLHGRDVFASLEISRTATLNRLHQVLLNLTLRLRERYVLLSLREEQLIPVIADMTGPVRASAATLLTLAGKPAPAPKEALEQILKDDRTRDWPKLLAGLSRAREEAELRPGEPTELVSGLLDVLSVLTKHLQQLR